MCVFRALVLGSSGSEVHTFRRVDTLSQILACLFGTSWAEVTMNALNPKPYGRWLVLLGSQSSGFKVEISGFDTSVATG